MPWQCSIVENHSHAKLPGHMWKVKNIDRWFVRLPNGGVHDIHSNSTDGTPWIVTGNAPNFTVTPSINVKIPSGDNEKIKGWHGWLVDGVLSDDCEGRNYE